MKRGDVSRCQVYERKNFFQKAKEQGKPADNHSRMACYRIGLAGQTKNHNNPRMYNEHDKIMVLETGEVLTVIMDFTDRMEEGIVVKERYGRALASWEVRPAGRTREIIEAAGGIVPSTPFRSMAYEPV